MTRERMIWIFTPLLSLIIAFSLSAACASSDDDDDDDDDTSGDISDDDGGDDGDDDVADDDVADDDVADDDVADDDVTDDDVADDDVADDDAADDDTVDPCGSLIEIVADYCSSDYEDLYQTVCIDNNDPDCLAYCYNELDACEDIFDCYNNDDCLL